MKEFIITESHLKLLKEMSVDWSDVEFGAPRIDPKRPYGNSDVHLDMRKILYTQMFSDPELDILHKEMETVLQICLVTQKFEVGKYRAENYDDWKKVI